MNMNRHALYVVTASAAFALAGCQGKSTSVTETGTPVSPIAIPGKPAIDRASSPTPDTSTPKATLIAFGKALEAGDVNGVKALTISDEKSDKLLEAFVPTIAAMKHLSEVSVTKFGEAGKSIGNDSGKGFELARDVENAHITETGDTATATMKDSKSKDPIKLKKVNGQWKVDFASAMGPQAKAEDIAKIAPMFTGMTKAANESAAEIEAGKYKTAEEAKQAVGMKMMTAMFGGMADLMKDAAKKGGAPGQGNPFGGAGHGNPFGGAPGSSSGK